MFIFGSKIDVHKIKEEIKTGKAMLVDVRRDDEWNSNHAVGAIHFPVDRITHGEVPTSDVSRKIYLYCASGGRSAMATHELKKRGYLAENIGGLGNWQAAGGAIE
ncbi:MAG: rhodanese-like domain-containing protein [Patescibacteria group bacterium]